MRPPEITVAALVVTLLPFYYGALRHLDIEYSRGSPTRAKPYALLVDFFGLFLESCAFLALGAAVDAPRTFGWTFVALLGIDIIWAAVALRWLITPSEDGTAAVASQDRPAERGWLLINIGFGALLVVLLVLTRHWPLSDTWLRWPILGLALARTSVDLVVGWPLYSAQ